MRNNIYSILIILLLFFHAHSSFGYNDTPNNIGSGEISTITWTDPLDQTSQACEFISDDYASSQSELDAALMNWVSENTNSLNPVGGCSEIMVSDDFTGQSIDICSGGEINVTWTLSDTCDTIAVSAYFILFPPEPLNFVTPVNLYYTPCSYDQSEMDTIFYEWVDMESIGFSGGCNPSVTTDWNGIVPGICSNETILVTWVVEDFCETLTANATFTVAPPPLPEFIDLPEDMTITCEEAQDYQPQDLTYYDSACDSIGSTPGVVIGDINGCEGNLQISWTYEDPCGNILMHVQSIEVVDSSECEDGFPLEITGSDFCEGDAVILMAPGGYVLYEWSTGQRTIAIEIDEAGTYSLTVTDNSGCTSSSSISVTTLPIPMPEIMLIPGNCEDIPTSLNAGVFSSYVWNTGETSPIIEITEPGNYSVTVTDINGCSGKDEIFADILYRDTVQVYDTSYIHIIDTILVYDTVLISVTDTLIINLEITDVENNIITGIMKVFPNPTNSLVYIQFPDYLKFADHEIRIINEVGSLIYSGIVSSEITELPIEEIGPAGTYFIQVFDESKNLVAIKTLIISD